MKQEYDLRDLENFKINPHVWLQTLLAIAGDKEKKQEVVEILVEQSGLPPVQVERIISSVINVLMNDTRSN